MRYMVERLSLYWQPEASWVPEFVLDYARRDVGRREIDPETPASSGRRSTRCER